MIRRPPRSTLDRSSAASDVYKRQVVDGKVINGRHGIGGEWGHNFLDESGGKCYCGRIGCVETVLAGPAIQKYYKSISNHSLSVKEIVELYRNCLLYTSDAADERSSVDLGGRRIINKKTNKKKKKRKRKSR